MVAPLGSAKDLSDQQPLGTCWTMVARSTTSKTNPIYLNHVANFIDVAMVPEEHIFVGHKDHGFVWIEDNGKANEAPKMIVSVTPKKEKKLSPSRKKMKFGSLKKFSKKMIERLVEEQLIVDSIQNGILNNNLLYFNDSDSELNNQYVPHILGYKGKDYPAQCGNNLLIQNRASCISKKQIFECREHGFPQHEDHIFDP